MSVRATRWLWFVALFALLPLPWMAMGVSVVPAVRYAMLATAGLAVALTEGAQGPAPIIVGMFVLAAVLATGACGLLALAVGRLLGRTSPRRRAALTLGFIVLALLAALLTQPYRTPYGHGPRGGLVEIFS
jgi:hypothetical protein